MKASPIAPTPARRRSKLAIVVGVVTLHALVILALTLGSPPPTQPGGDAALDVVIARAPLPMLELRRTPGRSGGAAPAALKRAPARSPRIATVADPPTHITPAPLVDARPAATPHLTAPVGPTLDAPVVGPGASLAAGGSGAGAGVGAGGFGGEAEPHWLAFADADTVERLYPTHAYDHHIEGLARLRCRLPRDGRPRDCRVLDETPKGEAFGRAALALARYGRLEPLRVAGRPVEDFVTFPIVFSLRDVEPVPQAPQG